MQRVVLRKCIKRAQSYLFALKCEKVPLQIEFTAFAAKKPQPLCETWNEMGLEKRNCGHRLIMHSITHRGGGAECEKRVGGGGTAPLQKYKWARLNLSGITKCEKYKLYNTD
jgi:hypothetical protein